MLFVVMHLPRPPGAELVERLGDKVVHAAAYFVLVMLCGWARIQRGRSLHRSWACRWWLIYTLYAAVDELLQPLVGRYCQWSDWVADVVGVLLALLLWLWAHLDVSSKP